MWDSIVIYNTHIPLWIQLSHNTRFEIQVHIFLKELIDLFLDLFNLLVYVFGCAQS